MLAGQVLSTLRARGQATLDASAAHAAGSSPRFCYELEEAVDPVNEGPGERPPFGPGLPPSIHASGVDCWSGLIERLGEPTDLVGVEAHVGRGPPSLTLTELPGAGVQAVYDLLRRAKDSQDE